MLTEPVEIIPFNREVPRDQFSCGNSNLDSWLKNYAGQNEDKFRTRTFFAIGADSKALLGYYTTVFGSTQTGAQLDDLPALKYPRPAFLIARLAVDLQSQKRGVGALLLSHALNKAIEASESAGLEVVIVDAIDSNAIAFYDRFGFTRFDGSSNRMYLTMKQLTSQEKN